MRIGGSSQNLSNVESKEDPINAESNKVIDDYLVSNIKPDKQREL